MKKYSGTVYVTLLAVIAVALIATCIPSMMFLGSWATPPVVLFLGLAFALVCGQPYPAFNKKMSKQLLQYSVVGLGFGMNVEAALASGKDGMMFTVVSVFGTLLLGWLVGRLLLKVDKNTSYLISSGTAICGGSAIAAVGPVIKAEYYIGVKSWWLFLLLGVLSAMASLLVANLILSILLGVVAFSSFWSIGEVFQQKKRVEKGWFPANPKKKK